MSRKQPRRASRRPSGEPPAGAGTGLVLADIPERVRLRELQEELARQRDEIAEIDLGIETLRHELSDFEEHYHARLAAEHELLSRIQALSRHLERWAELLAREPREIAPQARRIDARRGKELSDRPFGARRRSGDPAHEEAPAGDDVATGTAAAPEPAAEDALPDRTTRLKEAYRALARRYHPDLCRTEEERLRHGAMMTRINALYRAGDLERLVALAEQAKGPEIEDPELEVEEQLAILSERAQWFAAVIENLREERASLERSPTCEMMRNVQQAEAMGRDLVAEVQAELRERVKTAYKDVRDAVRLVEQQVAVYNRRGASGRALTTRRRGEALQRVFDPFADKGLVRVGLEHLAQHEITRSAREIAEWVEEAAQSRKPLVRLLMLTYVSELSPFPLEGLETYEDIELRFDVLNHEARRLGREEGDPPSLEQTLVEGDDLVEYGVKRATDKVVHLGLRFRSNDLRQAMMVALRSLPVRRILREVLGVLGEYTTCPECNHQVFPVPLYRLRGIDHMRSNVCPRCGHLLTSYWMPKGKDVQAVLNQAFLDFELISEWSFTLARSSMATQLVPVQVERWTAGDLKRRIVDDVFTRYEIEINRGQVSLLQDDERVPERTPLSELDERSFVMRFAPDAPVNEADALELVRHRIRNRFR